MPTVANLLQRRDTEAMETVERAFQVGALAEALESAPDIERRSGLTAKEFEWEYRRESRPVVLEGYAADWPSVRTWSFDNLAERCGSAPVTVNGYNSKAARSTTFAEFVAMLKQTADTDTPPLYLQEWYYKLTHPELAKEMPELDIAQYDFRRDLYGEAVSTNHQLWLGQKGGITPLHHDAYSVDVMHVQIVGEKVWYIMGPSAKLFTGPDGVPDLAALLAAPDTQLTRFVLRPGDLVYLPAQWLHRIELTTDSIGLGRKCLDKSNLRQHIRQRFGEMLAILLNPDELRQTHPLLVDVTIARARALAHQMDIDLSRVRQ